MNRASSPLRTVVVGLNRGKGLTQAIAQSKNFKLEAVCDLAENIAVSVAEEAGISGVFTDYLTMLSEIKPEVVVIATPHVLHAEMTFQAVDAGVKAIYCEKPAATNMADARAMIDKCKSNGVALVIGHQRRMSAAYRTMRQVIEEGILGDIYLIRGACPGDILSDVSHLVDSIRFLNGDRDVKWVLGQIYREFDNMSNTSGNDKPGWRQGHLIESGAMGSFEFDNGVRAEILSGNMRLNGWDLPYPGWSYQDIEVFGTRGRMWRNGDMANPPIRIFDERGGWRPVPVDSQILKEYGLSEKNESESMHGAFLKEQTFVFDQFAQYINEGTFNSLSAENVIKGFEILMAVMESARLRKRIYLPLEQDRYPLEIMVEEGQM